MRINAGGFNPSAFKVNTHRKFINPTGQTRDEGRVAAKDEKDKDASKNSNVKANSLQAILKSISESKKNIIDRKNELINRTIENGGDITAIAEPLKMYEEQLKNLDKELKAVMARETQRAAEERKTEKTEPIEQVKAPKTEEEAQAARVNATAEKIGRFDEIKGSMSMVDGMKARVKVLESEVELDGSRRAEFIQKVVKLSGGKAASIVEGSSAKREAEIAELNGKIVELTKDTAMETEKINTQVKEENKAQDSTAQQVEKTSQENTTGEPQEEKE
ncbi:MAG: hypothetical protein RR273_00435 [Oscillospiraceae bacterium]